jgi:ABC-type amino acid transport system permease subunit
MSSISWIFIGCLITYIILICIGLRYPRGAKDWPFDRSATLYIIITIGTSLLVITLLWYVSTIIQWPDINTMMSYVLLIGFILLIVIGLFASSDVRSRGV